MACIGKGVCVFSDLVSAGGPGLLIPVVLFGLLLYAVRGLFGLHGRRSQHRREFLEHWDRQRIDDDLWLEVTIRHLYGTSLPAHVIRAALAHPHASQALFDLSELWELLDYDAETRCVRWRHARHGRPGVRRFLRYWPEFRYALFALVAVLAGYIATRASGVGQWVFSSLALITGAGAFLSVWHGEDIKAAARVGDAWVQRINAAAPSAAPGLPPVADATGPCPPPTT